MPQTTPEKPSVSGLMAQHHEVSRFENMFMKQVGTAYYFKTWGLDWVFWIDSPYQLPINSLTSYLTQQCSKQGVLVDSIVANIDDFTLQLKVNIDGVQYETSRGFE